MRKWVVIARNEYLLLTSGMRRVRLFLPFIAIAIVVAFVVFVSRTLDELASDDITRFFISQAALATVEVALLVVFLFFVLFPFSLAMQDTQTMQIETLLAAPVEPKDLLLGRFIGATPVYAIAIAAVAGLFIAVISPVGLNTVQQSLIAVAIVLSTLSALWIGNVLASFAKSRLMATARGKDIGKALAMFFAIPIVALMYALIGGGLSRAFADPDSSALTEALLSWIPASWAAALIDVFTSHPGNLSSIVLETTAYLAALALFLLGVLLVGYRFANRVFDQEPGTLTAARAKPEGALYRAIRFIAGGGSFGTLFVSIFKDYGRRYENISKLVYAGSLVIMIIVFLVDTFDDPTGPMLLTTMVMAFMAAFLMGEVTVRGKENLFIYRKAPNGESNLLKTRLMHGFLIILPMAFMLSFSGAFLVPGIPILDALVAGAAGTLLVAGVVVFSLGLMLVKPVFSENPRDLILHLNGAMFLVFGVFILAFELFRGPYSIVGMIVLLWVLASVMFSAGVARLTALE